MNERKISITIWGAEKGDWIDWYNDIKELSGLLCFICVNFKYFSALAIDTLCCSPPESSLGYLCSFSPSPTASMTVL